MTIPKRDKRKRRVSKALAYPPANKAILEPVGMKKPTRQCDYCLKFSDSIYCPRCGRVTNKV